MHSCPEGAVAQSPGLPLRLPWELKQGEFLNRKAVVSQTNRVATAMRL
jgi:hypothetical protein